MQVVIHNLHLLLLDSNESGMNVIYSHFIVRNTVKESFMVGKKLHMTKSGGSEAGKPWTLKSGGSSIAALQKFTPMSGVFGAKYNAYDCLAEVCKHTDIQIR